jgi:hypothetical protein
MTPVVVCAFPAEGDRRDFSIGLRIRDDTPAGGRPFHGRSFWVPHSLRFSQRVWVLTLRVVACTSLRSWDGLKGAPTLATD